MEIERIVLEDRGKEWQDCVRSFIRAQHLTRKWEQHCKDWEKNNGMLSNLPYPQSVAVDTDREKDINQLCKAVLELAPRNTGDSGTGAECPFCFGEGNWDGDISDMKHDLDCAYLIAKDLSTNSNNGH